eukprot:TRINITY_DN140_c0_g1_i1.p1 TRINITY_DN140_c0_g1~~TRINITY_DN140_c0_g1_i1.p1  ORF type:complete len:643 (-),score=107.39 TRINITY_DN140_c0_g1_i1:235-2163(-)
MMLLPAVWCVLLLGATRAVYLPGVTPVEYPPNHPLRMKTNSITSTRTAIPYDFFSLPFCLPRGHGKNPKPQLENFGEILWGDSIKPSPYDVRMLVNVTCRRLHCAEKAPVQYTDADMKKFKQRVEDGYRGHLILDNLPVAEVFTQKMKGARSFALGYPLGTPKPPKKSPLAAQIPISQINNHLAFTIKYNTPADFFAAQRGYRIVGFHVVAYSFKHDENSCQTDDSKNAGWYPRPGNPVTVDDHAIVWSYSVTWIEDQGLQWASRWDPLLSSAETDAKIHWFSIVNSCLIVIFLSGMVAMIMLRSLHRDFNRYNDPDNEDEQQEETGWKLVHAEVFRPPQYPWLLAVCVGTGCQLLGMSVITIIFALLGFLSPANRGGLMTAMLLLFILLGSYAGFVAARMCKMFRCQNWKNILLTGLFFPGQVFTVFFLLDLMLWGKHAATAVPFSTICALLGLWVCVSLPLVFVGAVVGYKRDAIEPPVHVNPIPRAIPPQKWFMRPPFTILMAGILPFGAAFIELFFILSSLWLNRFYYVFGFLALVFIILSVTCAEITIVMVYFQLCYEDYHWWWRSFFISGASGVHLFLYSIFYYATTLHIRSFWSTVLYFGWMLIISYAFAIITGTIGFLASFLFVRYIYASIKVD